MAQYSLLGDSGNFESHIENASEAKMKQGQPSMNATYYLPPPAPVAVGGAQPMMPYVILSPAPAAAATGSLDNYKHRQSTAFGAVLIVVGILSILWNVLVIGISHFGIELIGDGIWGGIIYIIAGSFGVAAGKRKSKCTIVTFMVLSIIAASLCFIQLIIGVIAAADGCHPYYSNYNSCEVNLAMSILLAISALVGGIIAICGSALGCRVLCCDTQSQVAQNGMPFVTVAGPGSQPQAVQVFYMASPVPTAVDPFGPMSQIQQPPQVVA